MHIEGQAVAGRSVRADARSRSRASVLLAMLASAPLPAMASNYDLVLTGMIATPLLVFGVGMMAILLFLRGRVPGWLRALATVLASALLGAGLWVFQVDTWPHWPYSNDGNRVSKGVVVAVFCTLWAGLLVQTCLLWSQARRRLPTR